MENEMAWTPRYVDGQLSIVPDDKEEFAERAIFDRTQKIEGSIRELIQQAAKDGKFEVISMLRVFGAINGLFGSRTFLVKSGPADPATKARTAEMLALDERLNEELAVARGASSDGC
jgi:hypothetical protein